MDIAIIGASGTIGRQIAISLVQEQVISPTARLQLVGRKGGQSEQILPALASDLADAYAEIIPTIEVIFSPTQIRADIIIVAAGQTLSATPGHLIEHFPDRLELAKINLPILKTYAQAIESQAQGEELILIVTNPVELGVHIFSQHHSRFRVIGMGAFLDTLRFRREIANELGIRRQNVQGLVLGEHGMSMVPCWSTVSAYGFNCSSGKAKILSLQDYSDAEAKMALSQVIELLATEGAEAAYQYVDQFSAALRTLLKPFITHCSGAKTPVGVAEIITRLVEILVSGNQIFASAQVVIEGEFLEFTGVTGVPVVLSHSGVRIEPIKLSPHEEFNVLAAATKFHDYLKDLS